MTTVCREVDINSVCYHCGNQGHKPVDCWFKTAKCFECSKFGHGKAACRIVKRPSLLDDHHYSTHKIGTDHSQQRVDMWQYSKDPQRKRKTNQDNVNSTRKTA